MEHTEMQVPARGQLAQQVQQANRIRAARNRHANFLAGAEHLMAGNRGGHALEQLGFLVLIVLHWVIVTTMTDRVTELASRIKLLLMDVDGVLTNGKLFNVPDAAGQMVETKGFDSQDGIALQWLNWKGIKTGVISGRLSPATVERARQVKMTYVYQGHIEKVPILEEILKNAGIEASEVAYVGDDLTDVVIMRRVGLAIATANARAEVKACRALCDAGFRRRGRGAGSGGAAHESPGALGGDIEALRDWVRPPQRVGLLRSVRMELAIRIQVDELPEGLFLATSDELPGLVAPGRTVGEALDIARDVARKLIEARRERDGVPNLPTTTERRDHTIVITA